MKQQNTAEYIEKHGIKPTANRILVANVLLESEQPLTLKEIEDRVASIDKSGVFRTLNVFREHHLIHIIEGAENGARYELCRNSSDDHHDDLHIHFYCESCKNTFCLDTPVPSVQLPEGFEADSCNYLIKGVCPKCQK